MITRRSTLRNSRSFRQPVAKVTKPADVETHPWYWNPNRIGAIQAPSWFMERVNEIDPELDVRYNPVTSKWGVWVRNSRFVHPICQGWKLLFIHHDQDRQPMPLDERLLGRLHLIDMKNSSAKAYFSRVMSEMERGRRRWPPTRWTLQLSAGGIIRGSACP
jgi:hypothetical protein